MSQVQEIPHEHRFQPGAFDAHEIGIIVGALNRFGGNKLATATEKNLSIFTWDQVQQALIASRSQCKGDSRDDVDDVIYNLKAERNVYVH